MGIYIAAHRLGHSAHHDIAVKKFEHCVMHRWGNGQIIFIAPAQMIYSFPTHAVGGDIFLKIHGIHIIDLFIAHGIGLYTLEPHAYRI